MKKFMIVFFVTILVLSVSIAGFAAPAAKQAGYPAGPIQKAERGFNNAVFGWTEIPKRIVDKTKETNPIKGLLLGAFQGTCKAFARNVSGVGDLATFPLGGYAKPAVLPDMPAAK
jgi:putative exosortase-associated protein (TIGR04073 family)